MSYYLVMHGRGHWVHEIREVCVSWVKPGSVCKESINQLILTIVQLKCLELLTKNKHNIKEVQLFCLKIEHKKSIERHAQLPSHSTSVQQCCCTQCLAHAQLKMIAIQQVSKVLLVVIFILCLSLFMWQFQTIYSQYSKRTTTTATSYKKYESLKLPLVTICPQPPFRRKQITGFGEEDFIRSTWKFEELFDVVKLFLEKTTNLTSIRSQNKIDKIIELIPFRYIHCTF